MKQLLQDIAAFSKSHWPHVIIAIPAAIAFTALHELAHCVAVWVQGGSVIDFAWLPSLEEWGHMQYSFPMEARYSGTAVSLSPYAFWILFCLLAGILALRAAPWRFWFASTIFVWLFIVPLADIANTAAPYLLLDSNNDFRRAFGPSRPWFYAAAIAFGAVSACCGFFLNRRLYRQRAVRLPAYCLLAGTTAIVVLAISTF